MRSGTGADDEDDDARDDEDDGMRSSESYAATQPFRFSEHVLW